MRTEYFNGIPVTVYNEVTNINPKFYVSYDPTTSGYGIDTTAIVIQETSQFLVLKGDHRKELKDCDFNDVLKYFYDNIDKAHEYSEHGRIFKDNKYIKGGY